MSVVPLRLVSVFSYGYIAAWVRISKADRNFSVCPRTSRYNCPLKYGGLFTCSGGLPLNNASLMAFVSRVLNPLLGHPFDRPCVWNATGTLYLDCNNNALLSRRDNNVPNKIMCLKHLHIREFRVKRLLVKDVNSLLQKFGQNFDV